MATENNIIGSDLCRLHVAVNTHGFMGQSAQVTVYAENNMIGFDLCRLHVAINAHGFMGQSAQVTVYALYAMLCYIDRGIDACDTLRSTRSRQREREESRERRRE